MAIRQDAPPANAATAVQSAHVMAGLGPAIQISQFQSVDTRPKLEHAGYARMVLHRIAPASGRPKRLAIDEPGT